MVNHYIFDASKLVDECLSDLQRVIDADERTSRVSHAALYDLKEAILGAEIFLLDYVQSLLRKERKASKEVHDKFLKNPPNGLTAASLMLREAVSLDKQPTKPHHGHHRRRKSSLSFDQTNFAERSSADTLLFRLIVALNLCLVRIDDACFAITGARKDDSQRSRVIVSSSTIYGLLAASVVVAGTALLADDGERKSVERKERAILFKSLKVTGGFLITRSLHKLWLDTWMTRKIMESIEELEAWNRKWHELRNMTEKSDEESSKEEAEEDRMLRLAKRRQRLVEYALHDTPKASIWHSQGELRFLMLKRAMDIFYASVGTAVQITGQEPQVVGSDWKTSLVAAGAASFYSLIGANRRASEVTSCSSSARKLIQNAWGMVSLPSIKTLSLQVSKILKGASVADRIVIAGVSCYVLSKDPAPELAAALQRFNRTTGITPNKRRQLSTIIEEFEMDPSPHKSSKHFARTEGRYRQRDVIFHLTGGGFFAHIIASDLPYLLDWSAATGAVVICPEYSLLPEHCFPDALDEVVAVYRALVRNSETETIGFEVDKIIVTGESTGGNLAASLCIKVLTGLEEESSGDESPLLSKTEKPMTHEDSWETLHHEYTFSSIRAPDALMLSCAVLNLSSELTSSRVIGHEDPVLPSGLISAISDTYAPPSLGASKKDPLVSPFFVSDFVLGSFPSTLLFASSNDPLLDDSVVFNQRLRNLGVDSELRVAQNMPHAYLGLGTAGFPEAVQVQDEIKEWLSTQFSKVNNALDAQADT